MIIAVENGMSALKQKLRDKGHRVVPLYGYNGAVDAIVYEWEPMTQLMPAAENFTQDGSGIFVVCGRNMTTEEIVHAIELKSYGGVFMEL
ncbi:MAG: hypothetical protein E7393_03965 [Ruminococcaceae bacterium]|nr:hypothetical protein [Oscillospiraceae bacterium]